MLRNQQQNKFRCCFGLLHVRTATCIIGLWHLMLNLLAITLLAVIVKNPSMVQTFNNGNQYEDEPIPTPVSSRADLSTAKSDSPLQYRDHSMNYQDMDMGGLVCLCMIAITLMLIYGSIKGRPSHLLPFFFLQLCDFAITTLTAAGYLCYLRTVHNLIEQSNRLPWKEQLVDLDPRTLGLTVLFAFIFMVMLKAYCIGIVWRCYKYLTIVQNASLLTYILPEAGNNNQERSYNSLLPDYDEAIAQNLKITPPPSYQVAMQHQQNLTVALSPPTGTTTAQENPTQTSMNDSEPPSYNVAAQQMEESTEIRPAVEGPFIQQEQVSHA